MSKLRLYISVIFILYSTIVRAQVHYQPLLPGQAVPDLSISVRPGPGQAVVLKKLSDYRGKLLVLDFWGAYCVPCIKAFPKLMELQKEFPDSLKILLVNSASASFVDSVFYLRSRTMPFYQSPRLAQVHNDTALRELFPSNGIPHYVWISPSGTLITQTEGSELTSAHIRSVLRNEPLRMKVKHYWNSYDADIPLFPQLFVHAPSDVLFYSGVTARRTDMPATVNQVHVDSLRHTVRITRGAVPLLALLTDALCKRYVYGNPFETDRFDFGKRVILEVKDSSRLFHLASSGLSPEDWKYAYHFGYEGVFPLRDKERIFEFMLADICRLFRLEAHIEKRPTKCLALVRTSQVDKVSYRGGKDYRIRTTYLDTNGVLHLEKTKMISLRKQLSLATKDQPVFIIDQTNYAGDIDMVLHSRLDDLAAVKKELRTVYDLDLVETETVLDYIIIRDQR